MKQTLSQCSITVFMRKDEYHIGKIIAVVTSFANGSSQISAMQLRNGWSHGKQPL